MGRVCREHSVHGILDFRPLTRCHGVEVGAPVVIQHHREFELAQADERLGELMDGIIFPWKGAVPTLVPGLDDKRPVTFFAILHLIKQLLAVLYLQISAIRINAVFRIN